MIKHTSVYSNERPKIVDKDISSKYVYVRSNIREELDKDNNTIFIYDEVLYEKEVYEGIDANTVNLEQDLLLATMFEGLISIIGVSEYSKLLEINSAVTLIDNKSLNTPLINTYARLVNAKIKTIDDIPNNFKEEVRKINNAY